MEMRTIVLPFSLLGNGVDVGNKSRKIILSLRSISKLVSSHRVTLQVFNTTVQNTTGRDVLSPLARPRQPIWPVMIGIHYSSVERATAEQAA